MSKVAKSFICRGCLNPVTSAGRSSVDIGASTKLELVDKFCYLCNMLSVDGERLSEREDCQAHKLNKEDAMDRCKWRKLIKDV